MSDSTEEFLKEELREILIKYKGKPVTTAILKEMSNNIALRLANQGFDLVKKHRVKVQISEIDSMQFDIEICKELFNNS